MFKNMNRNDITCRIGHFVWGAYIFFISCLSYRNWFPTDGAFFVVCLSVFVIDGIVAGKYFNTTMGPLISVSISFGLYTVFANRDSIEGLFFGTTCVTLSAMIIFSYLFYRWNYDFDERKSIIQKYGVLGALSKFYCRFRCFLAVIALANILIVGIVSNHLFESVRYEIPAYTPKNNESDDSIFDMMELYSLNKWKTAEKEVKKQVCVDIVAIEKEYLGLFSDLKLEWKDFPQKDSIITLGAYSEQTHTVYLSYKLISGHRYDRDDILEVILHEMYHALENEYLKMFADVPDEYDKLNLWEVARSCEFFTDYIPGNTKETFSKYFQQGCEVRAREYSQKRKEAYIRMLDGCGKVTCEEIKEYLL